MNRPRMEERLQTFLNQLEQSDEMEDRFSQEFQSIRKTLTDVDLELSTEVGGRKENIKKNRYKDILPFDQTRVPLTLMREERHSDYINANFVRGVEGYPAYIATQGPLNSTIIDLWRMIWEYRIRVIVMACKEVELGKKKCECYWAFKNESVTFGPFTISNLGEDCLGDEGIIRSLSVEFLREVRKVSHFQYLTWPDHSIPQNFNGLLDMIEQIHKDGEKGEDLICVHCSAGCGRTGVICTVDFVWNLLQRQMITESFSIPDIVRVMRCQRPSAVQTQDQYQFLYHIVGEMFRRKLSVSAHQYKYQREQTGPRGKEGSRPSPTRRPRSCSLKPCPLLTAMAGEMAPTYASVSHSPRCVPPNPVPEYENLPETSKAPPVLAKPRPGDVLSRSREMMNYATLSFGTPVADGESPGGLSRSDNEVYDSPPALPQRTPDSFILDNQDVSRTSSFSSTDGVTPRKTAGPPKLTFVGTPRKEASASTNKTSSDDCYEDISEISTNSGLAFNSRVPKPQGPRDPPLEWAQYGR